MHARTLRRAVVAAAVMLAPQVTLAQDTTKAVKVVTPAFDFSGVIYGNYQYWTDSARRASNGGKDFNKFDIERVYLTFRMPVGDNANIRVTTDILNNANGNYYNGWSVRLKYAYLEYLLGKNAIGAGSNFKVRVGMMQNTLIDYEENFWPRWIGTTITDRLGYFPSSDAGVGAIATLPNKAGEIYGTVTNGSGYSQSENNRFKDFSLRAAFTPFGQSKGLISTFAIAPWIYLGENGSKFATGGAGQIGPVTEGLTRNRYGVFVGLKDPRLTAGFDYSQRKDQSEGGANTVVSPRTVFDSTGRAIGLFGIVRPGAWANATHKSPWGLIGRWDRFTPNTSPSDAAYAGSTPSYDYTVLGLFWEPTARTSFSVDWQNQSPSSFPEPFPAALKVTPKTSTLFVHWQASF